MTDKPATCPLCGSEENGRQTGLYMCGHWIDATWQVPTCGFYMWKRRAKKAEAEVERLREAVRNLRDSLRIAGPGTVDYEEWAAETERLQRKEEP